MKKIIFILSLFLTGCFRPMPDNIKAQIVSERYLDSLYKPGIIKDKSGIGFLKITDYLDTTKKDYLNRSGQQQLKRIFDFNHLSKGEWAIFEEKISNALSIEKDSNRGSIQLEEYKIAGTKYITAFLVDSTFEKVLAKISLK